MFGSILILLALPLLPRPLDARPGGFDKSNFKTIAPDQVLARLATADNIKIKDPRHTLLDKWHLKWCNGAININAEGGRELSCAMRSNFGAVDLSNPSLVQTSMQILFRSCGVYAFASDNDEGVSCGMLGRFFFRLGNIPAARAVWEHAPGCHAEDHGGHPVNGCIDAILGQSGVGGETSDARVDWSSDVNYMNAYASDPRELIKLASDACSKENDYAACQLLKSRGANVDLGSVAAYDNRRIQQNENAEAAADRAAQINAQEHRERVNALIGALQTLPDANDPNAIVDTANQQAANMVAVGAANDAARAQAAEQRAEEQRQQQAAQQVQEQQQQEAQASAQAAAQAAQPANNPPSGNDNSGGGVTCTNESNFVTATSKLNPDGIAVGFLSNNSNQPLWVTYTFARGGQPAKDETGSLTVNPGQTIGGEGGGVWAATSGASAVDSNPVKIYWFAVPVSDENKSCGTPW